MGVFDDLVRQQQQTDKPGQLTPQDQARQAQQQGGGWTPPPGYLTGNTGGTDPLQRTVLDRIGQVTGQYLPDNAAGNSGANPNSIFTQKELRKSDTAKNYASADLINQTTTDMKTEATNKAQDRLESRAIDTGLREAVTNGGYTGGIEFLKTVDPKQAMVFEDAKIKLDKSIMENDTYKMAHANDKLKVMAEGYGVLGNMGMAILQAKPGERQAMYNNILPLVKQVNPNASSTLDADAIAMFGLAQFQATDANKIANGPATQAATTTNLSKLYGRAQSLLASGADPSKPGELNDTLMQIQGEKAKATQAIDMSNKTKWDLDHKKIIESKDKSTTEQMKWTLTNGIQSTYDKESKVYTDKMVAIGEFNSALQAYEADPNNSAAKTSLVRTVGMIFNKGAFGVQDALAYSNQVSGLQELLKKGQSFVDTNGQVVIVPKEIGQLKDLAGHLQNGYTANQLKIDTHYQKDVLPSYPSAGKINFKVIAPPEAMSFLKANPSPQMIEAFKQKYHYDPSPYMQQNVQASDPSGRQ